MFGKSAFFVLALTASLTAPSFAQDVIKIGQEDYRTDLLAQMQRDHASPEEQKARLPQITFRDRLTIHLGGKEIQVLYLGKGHTRSEPVA